MFSLEHPALCRDALRFPGGIHCVRVPGESDYRIILKLPPSYLLPIKIHRRFRIYVIPIDVSGTSTISLMCAFPDDEDNPLVTWRPLDDSQDSADLLYALTRPELLVHLFDDHNRELLGYRATIDVPLVSKVRLAHATFPEPDLGAFGAAHDQAMAWFVRRSDTDDADAIQFAMAESLLPGDVAVLDLRPKQHGFHGSKGFDFSVLERAEPGEYQELDVIRLLQRIFPAEQIYHAPLRHYDREEIADVVVITDHTCLIVQAKDAPNTEKTLNRTLERKRLASGHMLDAALRQLSGAVKYLDRTRPLRMIVEDQEVTIDVSRRNILSLAIVRELFSDMYGEYSQALFGFFREIELPCIALDYAELHSYASFCPNEARFLGAYFQVFDNARLLGKFPRLRFGLKDAAYLLDGQSEG